MSDDHLNNEVSVSGELTEAGVNAKANSRTLAALDRLIGNVIDWPNTFVEADTARRRARMDAEKRIIEATAARAVQLIGTDDTFAARALAGQFSDFARKQINKEAVAAVALEDLRNSPPTVEEAADGPNELSPEFMDRFQSYAEEASTEELRERWGRVLASEIRRPGTFSRKVMRAVDELDSEVAALFERICLSRIIGSGIVREFAGQLDFEQKNRLVEDGLIIDPGPTGQIAKFAKGKLGDREIYFLPLGEWGMGIEMPYKPPENSTLLVFEKDTVALRIYALTSVGQALATILPDHEDQTYLRLFRVAACAAGARQADSEPFSGIRLYPTHPSLACRSRACRSWPPD